MKKTLIAVLIVFPFFVQSQSSQAQPASAYWQQRVKYDMTIDMNVETNRFTGKQKLEYWNNSPDTLTRVFYHLYWNAFQPGSMMDVRSQRQGTMASPRGADWDARVKDRIAGLKPNEIGYQKIFSLKMNGKPQTFKVLETILEVTLDKPIAPKAKVVFEMEFEAQVPKQIRRSGRDNAEGVRLSMSQWYPKLCEYDKEGWHPTPYIGREFYGVWGDYDVKISIDKKYIIGATGYLQDPEKVGYGYEKAGTTVNRPAGDKLLWRFVAPNVHDFAWAADPEFIHQSKMIRDSLVLHSFYKVNPDSIRKQYNNLPANFKAQLGNNPDSYVKLYREQWERVLDEAAYAFPFIDSVFGKYPYKQFSFIQGGDGGMEYPMATLINGAATDNWLHEMLHNWYYGVLATNESIYPWMDEGFVTFAENIVTAYFTQDTNFAHGPTYDTYYHIVKTGKEEALSTHADHYNLNYAYGIASYIKGGVFMEQLGYITGAPVRDKILLEYFKQWKFKHPDLNDFLKIAEKLSGMKLDWYKEYWINTTKTIDYAIDSLWSDGTMTKIRLRKIGLMPMPVDCRLTFKDGTKEMHYVPMFLQFGTKQNEWRDAVAFKTYDAWKWTHDTYIIETKRKLTDVVAAEIDPSLRMADVERKNNKIELKW
jgi:Peptidase family M1 domain